MSANSKCTLGSEWIKVISLGTRQISNKRISLASGKMLSPRLPTSDPTEAQVPALGNEVKQYVSPDLCKSGMKLLAL